VPFIYEDRVSKKDFKDALHKIYNMSREDFEVYRKFIDGPKPEVPSIDVLDEELDEVFDNIKERLGSKGYAAFVNKAKGAGAPPPVAQSAPPPLI
jgi:predicted transcriptional regulator